MRRKDWAWLMALVLVMELVLFACTCVQVNHHCPADAPCAICAYLNTMFRGGILPLPAVGLLIAASAQATAGEVCHRAAENSSLIGKKVRMNN